MITEGKRVVLRQRTLLTLTEDNHDDMEEKYKVMTQLGLRPVFGMTDKDDKKEYT